MEIPRVGADSVDSRLWRALGLESGEQRGSKQDADDQREGREKVEPEGTAETTSREKDGSLDDDPRRYRQTSWRA